LIKDARHHAAVGWGVTVELEADGSVDGLVSLSTP
jgi:hypothetical protein